MPNPKLPGADLPRPTKEDRARYGTATNSPAFDISYPEGSDVGYRWYDRKGYTPLYPFGFGLSYTQFRYDRLQASGGATVRVTFQVTNTGAVAGADVPQVYVTLPGRAKRLVGWDKISLAPGETKTVSVIADKRLLASYSVKQPAWIVAAGPGGGGSVAFCRRSGADSAGQDRGCAAETVMIYRLKTSARTQSTAWSGPLWRKPPNIRFQ